MHRDRGEESLRRARRRGGGGGGRAVLACRGRLVHMDRHSAGTGSLRRASQGGERQHLRSARRRLQRRERGRGTGSLCRHRVQSRQGVLQRSASGRGCRHLHVRRGQRVQGDGQRIFRRGARSVRRRSGVRAACGVRAGQSGRTVRSAPRHERRGDADFRRRGRSGVFGRRPYRRGRRSGIRRGVRRAVGVLCRTRCQSPGRRRRGIRRHEGGQFAYGGTALAHAGRRRARDVRLCPGRQSRPADADIRGLRSRRARR